MSRSALSSRTDIPHGQRRPSEKRAVLSRDKSSEEGGLDDNRNDDYDPDNDGNDQEIEETPNSKKRGLELLRDALELVSNKRQKRRGLTKYVLSDT